MKTKSAVASFLAFACSWSLALADPSQTTSKSNAPAAGSLTDAVKNIPLGPGKLDFGLNLRTRYEFFDNFNGRRYGTGEDDSLLLLRTRVSADYRFLEEAHVYAEMQDARHWLSDLKREAFPINCPFYDEFELKQAFFEWKHIGKSPVGFKAGRQTISYADARVFGPGEWGNIGRYWWDAAKVYVDLEWAQLDFLYGQRIISEPTTFNDDHFPYQMAGIYAQGRKFTEGEFSIKPDVFYIVRYDDHGNLVGESGVGDENRHSLGFAFSGTLGRRWDFAGTLVGQGGGFGRDDIQAAGANARVGYTFDALWSPRVAGEFSYASGDDDPNDGTRGTFDGVFGAIDTYYGRMNLVSWMNLEDYQFTFEVKPARNLKVWADYHFLRLNEARDSWYYCTGQSMRRDRTGNSGRALGHEIDLLVQWQINKYLDLFAGYSHFFAGSFIERTRNAKPALDASDANWLFAQLTFKF